MHWCMGDALGFGLYQMAIHAFALAYAELWQAEPALSRPKRPRAVAPKMFLHVQGRRQPVAQRAARPLHRGAQRPRQPGAGGGGPQHTGEQLYSVLRHSL